MNEKNGKVFRKFNIIDAVIIAVVLLVVAFVGYKFIQGRAIGSADTSVPVYISFYHESAPNYVVERIEKGDRVIDSTGQNYLGDVVSIEVDEAINFVETPDGNLNVSGKEGYSSLIITVEGKGQLGSHGVTVGGTLYGIGHSLAIYAGDAKLYLSVSDIQPLN